MARLGRARSRPGRSRGRAPPRQALAARINAIFDHADVVLHARARAGRRSASASSTAAARCGRSTPSSARVPYYGVFNVTGQPGGLGARRASTRDGLPLAVQLVGRPRDEATLLSLAAQIEQARPWADRRPPL